MNGYGLELAVKEPLPALGVLEAGAPVVVDFKDLALRGLDPVVVAVTALPPPFTTQRTQTKAIVRPGFNYLYNHILAVIEAEGGRHLNLAAYADLNLPTKKLWNHNPYLLE